MPTPRISTDSWGGAREVFSWEYLYSIIKIWTIHKVYCLWYILITKDYNLQYVVLASQHQDYLLLGLTVEDYKKMQNIILDILYCFQKIKTN